MAWTPITPVSNPHGVKSDLATFSITEGRPNTWSDVQKNLRVSLSREFAELHNLKKGDTVMLLVDKKKGKPILGIKPSKIGFTLQQAKTGYCLSIKAKLPSTFPEKEICSSTEIKVIYVNQ